MFLTVFRHFFNFRVQFFVPLNILVYLTRIVLSFGASNYFQREAEETKVRGMNFLMILKIYIFFNFKYDSLSLEFSFYLMETMISFGTY